MSKRVNNEVSLTTEPWIPIVLPPSACARKVLSSMNKAQLVQKLAEKTKLSKVQSEAVIDAALEIIQKTVQRGDDVKLVGFGTFSAVNRKAKKGRNLKTGEEVAIPGVRLPRFKPGKDFKSRLT